MPDSFNKLHLADVPDVEGYRDAVELIRERLQQRQAALPKARRSAADAEAGQAESRCARSV